MMIRSIYHNRLQTPGGLKRLCSAFVAAVFLLTLLFGAPGWSRTLLQIVPTLTISEEYSDNYLQTRDNPLDEYITTATLGFSMGLLGEKHSLYLSYAPEYIDYRELDERDRIAHNIRLDGEFSPTRHTRLTLGLIYDGDSDNYEGETRNHIAEGAGTTQLSKMTVLTYSHRYSDQFSRQARTGTHREHTVNTSRAGLQTQYGKRDFLRLAVLYEFDEYDTPDADAYTYYEPSAFLSYWFNPGNGMDANLSYEDREFDDTNDYVRTMAGDIRYIRSFSRKLEGYLKYRHSYSETETYTHHTFHPSLGVDWEVTDDAGISLGAGALFHDYSNENDDSTTPFLDLNAYKNWEYSRRGSLSLTASSGYSDAGEGAASLGHNVFYQAGARWNYQLGKRVTSNLFGSFRWDEYEDENLDRTDRNLLLGAGITWQPLQWLQVSLNYTYTDFDTSDTGQDDFRDNRIFFSVTLTPEKPVRMETAPTRRALEESLYTWDH